MDLTEHDQFIWEEELSDFVSERVFDAHIHLFSPEHMPQPEEAPWDLADLDVLRRWATILYDGRPTSFLTLGSPLSGIDVQVHNRWCMQEIQSDGQSRFQRLVTPECNVEDIYNDCQQVGVVGLKPYRIFSITGDIKECRIHEFLPHEQMELANDLGLWVTLHLSRQDACADEHNLADLEEYTTRRYPNIKWILAHVARSFTYWPIKHGIERLRLLPNIYYDTSAVTELMPLVTLFKHESPDRIFYGSDGVDSMYFYGKYVALGRAWQGLDVRRTNLQFPHCDARPILAIYEQLLSMKHAAEIAGLDRTDLDKIFYKNAQREFGVIV